MKRSNTDLISCRWGVVTLFVGGALLSPGCHSSGGYRREADRVAYRAIAAKQEEGLGETEPFTISQPAQTLRDRLLIEQNLPVASEASMGSDRLEPSPNWPSDDYLEAARDDRAAREVLLADAGPFRSGSPVILGLEEALRVAARNSREYQREKEDLFRTALALDLADHRFDTTLAGSLSGLYSYQGREGGDVYGVEGGSDTSLTRQLQNGATLTTRFAIDLARLLTQSGGSSLGIVADASVEIPLLRGAGRWVVAEPLIQAERNTLYAVYRFERFKREFAVTIASSYLNVLRQRDQVDNAEENYRGLITSSRRVQALADEGRVPEIQVGQAVQDELRARNRWISAIANYEQALDQLKNQLGLPTDALIELDRRTLGRLADRVRERLPSVDTPVEVERANGTTKAADEAIELAPPNSADRGPLELDPEVAIALALQHRLDLRVSEGGVYDAMRQVAVAANAFLPELTLLGRGSIGEGRSVSSATQDNAEVRFDRGSYSTLLEIDLPFDRVSERNAYRSELIDLERAVRNLQALEDGIKLAVRSQLREMVESRESLRIQAQAVALAERRVDSTGVLLELGRAEIRDVLEAQEALLSAQNALTSALVNYRVSELELQRDLGLLEVNENGLWKEFRPEDFNIEKS